MQLTARNVHDIIMDCLFKQEEVEKGTPEHIIGHGVMTKAGFHPERLASHKDEIASMCDELPDEFKMAIGGGSSFLNACLVANGQHWGEHRNIDELLCLGLATGKIEYLMTRDMWSSLPGDMPYFVVK